MNKLTDSEIVKALEKFHHRILKTNLSYHIFEDEIMSIVNALDLIKRKDAEIENLYYNIKCVKDHKEKLIELNNRQKAEIERLLQKLQHPVVAENAITVLREKCIEHQDFHKGDNGAFRAYVSIEDLDNIINEM